MSCFIVIGFPLAERISDDARALCGTASYAVIPPARHELEPLPEVGSRNVTSSLRNSGTLEILSLFRDRRFLRGPAVWVILTLLALNGVIAAWRSVRED